MKRRRNRASTPSAEQHPQRPAPERRETAPQPPRLTFLPITELAERSFALTLLVVVGVALSFF